MWLAKINHSKEQRWRKYVFWFQGAYTAVEKSWLHTWQVSEQSEDNNDKWHSVRNRKTDCDSPGKGEVRGYGMVHIESEEGGTGTGSWLRDCCWIGGVFRGVVPKARREVEVEEARELTWLTFPDTDFPFVPRDLLSCNHKGLHNGVWVAQDKLASTSRGSKSILGDNGWEAPFLKWRDSTQFFRQVKSIPPF